MAKGKEMKAIVSIGGAIDPSLNKSIASAIASTKGMSTAMSASMGQAGRDIAKLDAAFGGIEKAAKAALSVVAVGAGAAAVGLGASIKVGAAFEQQMSTVEAISQAGANEMQNLSETALELASNSQYTASEVGQAMEYMGMAGWKAEDMLAGIDDVISLAAASGEDLATVSDILTDDLTAFGMSANEAGRMADVMAAAATNANTNVAMMGETFKYAAPIANTLGFSLEDVAVATGLMANSGIKAEQAGTSLRSWMSRMAAPTKQTAEAMDELGLSITNDDGSMKTFAQIIEETRNSMKGLSADEQARYANMIAGKNAMSGMLAVINSTEEDTRKLTKAIEESTGAAQKMADIRMDNLQGDVTKFKSALEGLGVSVYQEVQGPARDVMQWLTGIVNTAKDKLPKVIADIMKKLPEAARSVKKFIQPALDLVKDGFKWVIDHKKGVIGVITGVAAALVTYKIARKIMDITAAVKSLTTAMGPVGMILTGITAAVGALTAAITTYEQYEREMIDNNLAEHFGNVSLSLEEIQSAAEQMIGSRALEQAKTQVEEFAKASDMLAGLSTSETDKLNWKVSVGLELTEDEKETYKSEIDDFVKKSNEYVTQQAYAVSVSLKIFDPSSVEENGIASAVNGFYLKAQKQMQYLGTRLQNQVNIAFNDGILDIDEARAIQEIQRQMAEIEAGIATSKNKAAMHSLSLEYGFDLDAESSAALQQALAEQAETAKNTFKTAMEEGIAGLYAANLSDSELQAGIAKYESEYLNNVADAEIDTLDYFTNTVLSKYGELEDGTKQISQHIADALASGNFDQLNWQTYVDEAKAGLKPLDEWSQKAVNDYLQNALPTDAEIQSLVEEYKAKGQKIPEELVNSMLDFYAVAIQAGETPVLSDTLVSMIVNGEVQASQSAEVNDAMAKADENIAKSVRDNITHGYDELDEAAQRFYTYTDQAFKSKFDAQAINIDAKAMVNVHVIGVDDSEVQNVLAGVRTSHEYSAGGGGHYALAEGGFTQGVSIAGEDGQEAVISFKSSVRQRNVNIWKKAGEILGVTSSGSSTSASGETEVNAGGNKITFSPNITINGNANENDVISAIRKSMSEFLDVLEENGVIAHDERVAYG